MLFDSSSLFGPSPLKLAQHCSVQFGSFVSSKKKTLQYVKAGNTNKSSECILTVCFQYCSTQDACQLAQQTYEHCNDVITALVDSMRYSQGTGQMCHESFSEGKLRGHISPLPEQRHC